MRRVTYSMNVSLDGYIVGPDGSFDWSAPDKEVLSGGTARDRVSPHDWQRGAT
jgi:hypothetical protein